VFSGICREAVENGNLFKPNTFHNDYFHKRLQVADIGSEQEMFSAI
jgi:hypothetical protein